MLSECRFTVICIFDDSGQLIADHFYSLTFVIDNLRVGEVKLLMIKTETERFDYLKFIIRLNLITLCKINGNLH